MTRSPSFEVARRVATWALFGSLTILVGPPPVRAVLPVGAAALPLGAVGGTLLFGVLAGGRFPVLRLRGVRAPAIAFRTAFLTARSAYEEVVWRRLVLASLAAWIGAGAALAVSSAGFAGAHWRGQGRRMSVHLFTGGVFGGIYCLSGSLAAAIAAHATYNVLVSLALEHERTEPLARAPTLKRPPVLATLASSALASPAGGPPQRGPGPDRGLPVAEARDVVKGFGGEAALAGVTLALQEGELLALLGPNGAGKTTLLSLLVGLRRPDAGSVLLFGADPRDPRARASVGVTPQETGFPTTLRVREVLDLVRAHFVDPVPAEELLERFGLEGVARRQTGGLSSGQRRRLALALAFAGRPKAVFLDEPTAGLDVDTRLRLWAEIRAFVRLGGSVLLTSHNLEEVDQLATRAVILNRGAVVAHGEVSALRAAAGMTRVRLEASELPALPGVDRVVRDGRTFSVFTPDADALVAALVASGTPFSRLEVMPVSLEQAFLDLTAEKSA